MSDTYSIRKQLIDAAVIEPDPQRIQRWRCVAGCRSPRVVFEGTLATAVDVHFPMHNADIEIVLEDASYFKTHRDVPTFFTPSGPPVCKICRGPVFREGLCGTCNKSSRLDYFVRPPDFDPEIDDPARPNTCERCFVLLGSPIPPPPKPAEPQAAHITAESYEALIVDARGRVGLRRALIRAAKRDHPDDPRWSDFE